MVDESAHITGILDWEYANMTKPSEDMDWKEWMHRTAPKKWDITGLMAARSALF